MKTPARLNSLLRGRPGALCTVALVLAGIAAATLWAAPPIISLPTPRFSLDPNSPAVTGGPPTADDILEPNLPFPTVVVDGPALGLGDPNDDIDGLSGNIADPGGDTFALLFSVDRATIGAVVPDPNLVAMGVPYNVADQAARRQASGDLFSSTSLFSLAGGVGGQRVDGNNYLCINQFDEGGTSFAVDPELSGEDYNINPEERQDNVDAAEGQHHESRSGVRDGNPVYFSLTSDSPTLSSQGFPGWQHPSGARIFYNANPGQPTAGYAAPIELGLLLDDDIDALIVFDTTTIGDFDDGDRVLFSLEPNSPSLLPGGIPGVSSPGAAADIFLVTYGDAVPAVFASASALGLGAEPDFDDVDALELLLCDDTVECARRLGIRRVPGDCNNDGPLGPPDFFCFADCMSGPGVWLDPNGVNTHVVVIGPGDRFSPSDLVIETADTVRWEWNGGEHNVVSGRPGFPDGHFDSGEPTSDPNAVFEFQFQLSFLTDPNHCMPARAYPYYCEVDDAAGAIVVTDPPCTIVDFDNDGDVDMVDFGRFQRAFGPL